MLISAPGRGRKGRIGYMNYTGMLKSFHFYVQHHEVPTSAQIIYLHMLQRDNELMWQEWFKFSVRNLMLFTQLGSPNTVRQGIAFLQKAGLIECQKRNRSTTQFKIMPPENFKSVSPEIQFEPEPEETNCINIDTDEKTVSNTIQMGKENCINSDTDNETVSPSVSVSVSPSVSNMIQFPASYNIINKNNNINKERGYPSNLQSSSLNEATDIFQNTFRPLKNIDEAEQIKAMVEEYGIYRFKEAVKIAVQNHARVPLPYLESVLRNNKASPQRNDPVTGAASVQKIIESGELLDFNSE